MAFFFHDADQHDHADDVDPREAEAEQHEDDQRADARRPAAPRESGGRFAIESGSGGVLDTPQLTFYRVLWINGACGTN